MTHTYFAYGSNMSSAAIGRRCPSATRVGVARLERHRLTFFLEDASWDQGGVAGVVPDPDEHVEGVVYTLSDADLATLDGYEALDDGDYTRAQVEVALRSGDRVEAWIYLPGRDVERYVAPAPAYLAVLLEGAHEHALTPAYVAKLESWARPRGAGADGPSPASSL